MGPWLIIGLADDQSTHAAGYASLMGFWIGGLGNDQSTHEAGYASLMGFWIGGLGSDSATPAPVPAKGWIGRVGRKHTRKELEEKLARQRADTFGRRWFEDYLAAQARALEKAEKAKSRAQREALEEAVEAAGEAVDAAIAQGMEVHDLTVALNAAASASRLTASIKHARNVVVLASTYEDDNDEETVELLLLH